jgi:hypothetical protein
MIRIGTTLTAPTGAKPTIVATPEAVLAAAPKHIEPAKISIVKGGDFAKISEPN